MQNEIKAFEDEVSTHFPNTDEIHDLVELYESKRSLPG